MLCVTPDLISKIDRYAEEKLNIKTEELMRRAGEAVAKETAAFFKGNNAKAPDKTKITVLCGSGNNGGDGYAAALELLKQGFLLTVVDIFGKGQRSEAGKHFLCEYSKGAEVLFFDALTEGQKQDIFFDCDCIIDAIFGTGARAELDSRLKEIITLVNSSSAKKIAVDIPLGADAYNGTLSEYHIKVDKTVTLCFAKRGLYSYPCRSICGEIKNYDIGIGNAETAELFSVSDTVIDRDMIKKLLPERKRNTHKGTYGKTVLFCGSDKYRGAAILATESALRTGSGLTALCSEESVIRDCCVRLPEGIYVKMPPSFEMTLSQTEDASVGASAILIGSGSGQSENLSALIQTLIKSEGAPLIIDADGINSISLLGKDGLSELFKSAKRKTLLTPHPAEMARLSSLSVHDVQSNRLEIAEAFASEHNTTVVLKGASTVITDGVNTRIDIKGGPELAKGGSGDVLAGAIASFASQGFSLFDAATVAVYLHSCAGKALADEFSSYGVCPSELPRQISREILKITGDK